MGNLIALTSTSPLTSEYPSNAEVHRMLGLRVAKDILGAIGDADLEIGSLCTNYFSFTFSVKAVTASGERSVFVKIPKVNMRGSVARILPITSGDRRLAQAEEDSLRRLDREWDEWEDVHWVNLCGTIPECNAIITNRIFAEEALSIFRRLDLRRRFGFRQDSRQLQMWMYRIGTALGRFHQSNAHERVFRLSETLPKFRIYCEEIVARTRSRLPERILRALESMPDLEIEGIEVPTLKGLDIRNVLIDGQDRLHFLDPGSTKFTHREADVARFVMTYRVLHWGSKALVLLGEPDRKAEVAFLAAYYANCQPPCPQMLGIFLLKEQMKHWHTALDSLQRMEWPQPLKRLVTDIYVNPFYARQVGAQYESIQK